LAIINIQQEKHKLVQGHQGIERTGRLSSRYMVECVYAVA